MMIMQRSKRFVGLESMGHENSPVDSQKACDFDQKQIRKNFTRQSKIIDEIAVIKSHIQWEENKR